MRLLVLALTACTPFGTQTRQSAVVPHVTPVRGNGQPMTRAAEVSIGDDTVVATGSPELGDDQFALTLPRTQLSGAVAVRSKRVPDATFRFMAMHGLRAGADQLADTEMPNKGVSGAGFGAGYSMRFGEFRVALAGEIHIVRVPLLIDGRQSIEGTGIYGFGATPSYRLGGTTLYGSMSVKIHPTVDRLGNSLNDDVIYAEPNLVWAAGIDQELGAGVRGGLSVFSSLTQRPVSYQPTLAAALTIPIAEAD